MPYNDFDDTATAFAEMANRMIYATLATIDRKGRPRSRMVHTLWQWDGAELTGWVGSLVTPLKQAHLRENPYVSCNFWDGAEVYDTCVAECRAELLLDPASKRACWELFASTPAPLGYDPGAIGIPGWSDGPESAAWGALRLRPWRLKVFPGEFARSGGKTGRVLTWQEAS